MKTLLVSVLLFSACALVWAADEVDPFADDGKVHTPCHVRVQVKLIETTQAELSQVLNNPQPLQEKFYLSIQRLMKKGKAKLVHESLVISRSGEKATAESIREMIYPTEYDPPGHFPIPASLTSSSHLAAGLRPYGVPPVAFETRNVGDTLEVEPTVSNDRKTIDLRFAPERVFHHGNITYLTHKDQWGDANLFFPEFTTQRINTAITLLNKETHFVSSYTDLDKEGKPDPRRKILVFVRATVITPR